MSIYAVWCAVSAVLVCNFAIYNLTNYSKVAQLGKLNLKNKTISLPSGGWGQLSLRGLLFLLGSIFFAAIALIVILIIKTYVGPFDGGDFALVLSSWLGGLYCAIVARSGAKISYWTAYVLQNVH